FSPDGKTLATICHDKIIRLWDVPSGKLRASLSGHTAPAPALAFLPDGTLATAGTDATIRFWDIDAGRQSKVWKTGQRMRSLAISPDGKLLAAGEGPWVGKGPSSLRVWDLATGNVRFDLKGHDSRIIAVAFTRDGRGLVGTGGKPGEFGEVALWDLSSGRLTGTHRMERHMEWNVAVSPDGQRIITASPQGYYQWDLGFVHKERTWTAHTGDVICGAFTESGVLATGGQDGAVKTWNSASGELLRAFPGHKGPVRSLAVLPDGTLLSGGDDAKVKAWDPTTGNERATFDGQSLSAAGLAVSPDGKTVAAGYAGADRFGPGKLILWTVSDGRPLPPFPDITGAVVSVAYSPDGALLAAATASGAVKVFDATTRQVRATLAIPGVGAVTVSPDGRFLATGRAEKSAAGTGDHVVRLWDTASWRTHAVVLRQKGLIQGVAYSPDGRTLASASRDGTIKFCAPPLPRNETPIAATARLPIADVAGRAVARAAPAGVPGAPAAQPATETSEELPKNGRWKGAFAVSLAGAVA
ncbi:MAG TPA: WD40 repeat domain-containing protein, partial [Gemmataceae bacterium]|nr:WD40 repeat domain-containing protein [Gemmataceae bacterium]